MEQKDYLLREIEKINLIIQAIRQMFYGKKDNLAIQLEHEAEAAKGMLFDELNFDLEKFLLLNLEESVRYLEGFEGFSTENMEQLAELLTEMGRIEKTDQAKKYLEKALQVFEIIKQKTKTFSFEREIKIAEIKGLL